MEYNRPIPKEEIQRLYNRWQQLKQQFGENAIQNGEFIQLSKILKQISKQQEVARRHLQQQQQQQQQQHQQSPPQQQQQLQGSFNNAPNGFSQPLPTPPQQNIQQPIINNHSPLMPQIQTPQPPPPQQIPTPNPNVLQQQQQQQQQQEQRNSLANGLFAPYQSILLKAQIAAFKCLVKNVPIPQEVNNILISSLKNNFGKNVSQQSQQPMPSNQPPTVMQPPPQLPIHAAAQSPPSQLPQSQPSISQRSLSQNLSGSATPSIDSKQIKPPKSSAPTIRPLENQRPIPFEKLKSEHPEITTIIPINDPKLQVDSYTKPVEQAELPYELLYHPKSRVIIPGVYPQGLDIYGAYQIKEATIQLELDAVLEELSSKLETKDDNNPQDVDDLIDYYSLKLLPLQKSMRGHILSFNHFKSSLLTNTHPNFLAKLRKINLQDANVTNNLYVQQQSLKMKIESKKKTDEVEKLASESIYIIKNRNNKKEQVARFGRSIVNMHGLIEKEEQKRIERNAKQRLQALKANDEEAYIKLLDQTKDTRITHLLKQTNQFLDSLAQAVKEQQKETHEQAKASGLEVRDEFENLDEEDENNVDYYSVAHRIKEEIKTQPSILVGGELKEYQLKGLQWMVSLFNNHLNGILADEMGLGKTIQSISLITHLIEVKKVTGPFLVIVPLSTLTNWNIEFEKWAPSVKKITYKGTPNLRKVMQQDIKNRNFQVLLTTFEYIIKDRPLLAKINWAHMIIDEGHRMKNANSKLSYTLTQYYHTDYRLILTGTPLQNNLPELWALLNFVLPKIFNSVKSFDEWFNTPFANTGGQDKIELSEEETLLVIRRLHKVLRPFLLRRLKKDVEKDLPNKVEKVIKCKMSAVQSKLYQHMLKYHQIFVANEDNTKLVPLKGFNNPIMQLRKICNHPFVFEDIENMINPAHETNQNIWRVAGKFELLERVLPKFKATGHRVLIFFQMTQIMDIMEDFLRLSDMKYLRLDGGTKPDDRTDLLKLFNAPDSEYFAFLLSTRAGGLGLNLQTADTVIIFDTDWNPHQDLQAQDRAHRIGQKNEVRILRLITEDSIEEVILERAHQKLDIDGKVIQAGKFDNKSTSEEQEALLRALLEAEESKKTVKEDDEELDDDELNEILSRDVSELAIFRKIDDERRAKGRLYTDAELPSVFSHDPVEFMNEDDGIEYGRGARERKQTFYDDNLTEDQWLKQIDGYADDDHGDDDDEDDGVPKKKVQRRKRNNLGDDDIDASLIIGKKRRSAPPQNSNGEVDEINSAVSTPKEDDPDSIKPIRRGFTPATGRARARNGRGPKGGAARGRSNTPANRVPREEALTAEERFKLNEQCLLIYNAILNYVNEDGRKLSEIFLVRPPKKVYPDYYLLIKTPIALDMIKKRISSNIYQSLKELLEDAHLMFGNAKIYNEEGSVVYQDAMTLEEIALSKYREIVGDEEAAALDFQEFDAEYGTTVVKAPAVIQ